MEITKHSYAASAFVASEQ